MSFANGNENDQSRNVTERKTVSRIVSYITSFYGGLRLLMQSQLAVPRNFKFYLLKSQHSIRQCSQFGNR